VRGGGQRRAKTVESGTWKPPYVLSSPNETTTWWVIAATVKLERRVHAVPRIPIVPRSAAARRAVGGVGIMGEQGGSASSMLAVPSQLALGAADLPRKAVVESSLVR
jgi:hypothetical protein